MIRSTDYVIAGGGTAGAVLARRLSDAGADVVIVEAGPVGDRDERVTVLRRYVEMIGSELDFDYRTEPGAEVGNTLLRHTQARVLGGCSAHNSCIAFRAPDWDFERWERAGNAGWGAADCAPYFDRVFSMVNIETANASHPWVRAFRESAEGVGLPPVDFGVRNVRSGVGLLKQNRRGELRESSAAAYLFPLADRPGNLRIATGETVLRVVLDDRGAAVGVDTTRGRIVAREEVLLCGGTFGSAKTLLLSGIGPAEELRQVGVEPVVDLPGVGRHLVDHPDGVVLFEATEAIHDRDTFTHWEAALFACLEGGEAEPEVMVHFDTMGVAREQLMAMGYPVAPAMISMHPNVTRARSEGSVRLRSSDPTLPLAITTGLLTDPDRYDERIMIEGLKLSRRIAQQPALARFITRELAPGAGVTSDEDLSHYVRSTTASVAHPAGTCKMGVDGDPLAVVDDRLRVRGVERLRVVDASVMPDIVTVNPCMTVMMIGERCSADILAGPQGIASGVLAETAS